jgi:hypothetical protein
MSEDPTRDELHGCVKEAMKVPARMSTKHRRSDYQGFAEGDERKGVAVTSREARQPYGVFLITI